MKGGSCPTHDMSVPEDAHCRLHNRGYHAIFPSRDISLCAYVHIKPWGNRFLIKGPVCSVITHPRKLLNN